jgi:hypothetical protein
MSHVDAHTSPSAVAAQPSMTTLALVILLAISCGLMTLGVGSLQPEDLVLLGLLWLCITKFIYSGFSIAVLPQIRSLFRAYSLFVLCLALMEVLAVRLPSYPLDNAPFLKQPTLFPASKLLQLAAVVCGFLWLTGSFAKRKTFLSVALNAYWWTGIVTCLYAIACYVFLRLQPFDAPDVFGAYTLDEFTRARGFFNEGGPLGIYIVSVFLVGLLRSRVTGHRMRLVSTAVLSVAFVLSASKAGFFTAATLILVAMISAVTVKARVFYCILAIASLCGFGIWLNFDNQLLGYWYVSMNIEEELAMRGTDYSVLMGRVSGMHIVPKMIASHPLTGIGFGNYSLMRNDPNYLDGLPAVTDMEDLPGLGLLGVAAEIGVPVTVWLVVLLFVPYWRIRQNGVAVASAALFQPMAHIFGMQITFFLPWFVTACAVGVSFYGRLQSVPGSTDPRSARPSPSSGSFAGPVRTRADIDASTGA